LPRPRDAHVEVAPAGRLPQCLLAVARGRQAGTRFGLRSKWHRLQPVCFALCVEWAATRRFALALRFLLSPFPLSSRTRLP